MKKTIIIGSVVILAIVAGFLLIRENNKAKTIENQTKIDDKTILFYGEACPHCKKVEEFIKNNQVDSKFPVEQKEVYNNKDNQALLGEKAKACKLDTNSVGVPFLWTGSDCIVGDQPIIDYLNQQISGK